MPVEFLSIYVRSSSALGVPGRPLERIQAQRDGRLLYDGRLEAVGDIRAEGLGETGQESFRKHLNC